MAHDAIPSAPKAQKANAACAVIGYYRFTDIFFEWHQALPNQADVSPLKALIAYSTLVHPEHPLRKQGVNGIELHLGTFENGEMRLLFSSAQVEYMRYWLHAVGLTAQPIPLPASEYLIQANELLTCSPNVYSDATALKRAIKVRPRSRSRSRSHPRRRRRRRRGRARPRDDLRGTLPRKCAPDDADGARAALALQGIDKNNKRLRGTGTLLTARRFAFERTRTLWATRLGTWLALDFEAWDMDHTLLTEFGWSVARWEDGALVREDGHLVVKEHRTYTQHYVPNHREFYNFGQSEVVTKHAFKQRIQELIAKHREAGPLFLVFHDHSQDVKYLKSDMVKAVERLEYLLPDSPQTGELYVVDTADLFCALEGDASNSRRSLERVCRHLQIPTKFLHNAGNDARYTLDALISMATGDPVDQQREQRWPKRTEDAAPTVEFRDWEEDDEYSDMEGVMGPPTAPGSKANGGGAESDDEF
ncbi:hypothetical protein BC628DRAFT_1310050 [Trametes gibbosa]|nr:hypothetical protein BC628DRAFT_1310050 [Trametes gibbosa]